MKFLTKLVAVLAIVLWVAPSAAAMACTPGSHMNSHRCCAGAMGIRHEIATKSMEAASRDSLAAPACCKISPRQSAEPGLISQAPRSSNVSLHQSPDTKALVFSGTNDSQAPWRIPDRAGTPTAQSRLCTFRI